MGLIQNPVIPDELCTLQTCSLLQAHFTYLPNMAGNTLYAAIFGVLLIIQIGFGIRYKTWGFLGGMFGGLLLEIIGYAARVQMHSNPFIKPPFLQYLICLTIGPAFLTAAIYLCLARIVVIYGEGVSRVKPRTYTVVFISCDFLSLLLQAAGGALASVANTPAQDQTGINIMVAGLSWQVFSLVLFIALCAEYAWRVSRSAIGPDTGHASTRSTFKFQAFLWSLGVATLAILIRSAFRVAELSQGFHGKLANQQVTFMILEGAMVVSACILLTVFHPGLAFGGAWSAATWTLRTREAQKVDKTPKASAGWRPMSMFRRISGGNEKFVGEHVKGVSEKEDGSIRGSAC